VRDCLEGRMLLVVDDLERLAAHERCGAAAVEELRRLLARSPSLDVVALCRPGGDRRLFDANPALVRSFDVARTRDFGEDDFAELFALAVARRGARVGSGAARAAGAMLHRTPPLLNLRGARLAEQMAAEAVAAAARREAEQAEQAGQAGQAGQGTEDGGAAGPAAFPEVTAADLPQRLIPGRSADADPRAELAACAGIEPATRPVDAPIREAKAAPLRHQAAHEAPA